MVDVFFYCLQRFIYFLTGRKHFFIYKAMMKNEFGSKNRLALLLSWAPKAIPRYKSLLGRNSKLGITDFPIVRKRDIQEELQSFVNPEYKSNGMIRSHTGGSTGEPTIFYQTRYFRDVMSAGVWRTWTWAGWKPGRSILYIWGCPEDIRTNWRRKVGNFVNRKMIINAFNCSESDYKRWVQIYNKKKPWLLFGYANSMGAFAKYILDKSISVVKPKAIVTSTEMLFPEVRRNIELAFGQKVHNSYALREMWAVASECKQGRLHIFTDICNIESVQDESGINHLLLTIFDNEAMPLIRYDTDDTGSILDGECPCGSEFPLMDLKVGRQLDFIIGPNGKRIDPYFLYYLMYEIQGISKYQFYQKSHLSIELKIVKNRLFSNETITHIKKVEKELKKKLSNDLVFLIKEVNDIRPGRTGKHKFIISEESKQRV